MKTFPRFRDRYLTARLSRPSQPAKLTRWQQVLWVEQAHTRDRESARRLFPAFAAQVAPDSAFWFGMVAGGVAAVVACLIFLPLAPFGLSFWFGIGAGFGVGAWAMKSAARWFADEQCEPWVLDLQERLYAFYRSDRSRLPPLPGLSDLETALRQACAASERMRTLWQPVLDRLAAERKSPPPLEHLLDQLEQAGWPDRFLAPYLLAALGGEAAPALVTRLFSSDAEKSANARRILESISADTMQRLAARRRLLVCPDCLTRFAVRSLAAFAPVGTGMSRWPLVRKLTAVSRSVGRVLLHPGLLVLRCCGCRTCNQSRRFLEAPQGIVAVLDENMDAEYEQVQGSLLVNALKRAEPFDFDRLLIRAATDRQVERFCITVGNDTDGYRRKQYSGTPWAVAPGGALAPTTLRMLDQLFGAATPLP